MENQTEIWVNIPDTDGKYMVSNLGFVKRINPISETLKVYTENKTYTYKNPKHQKERILKRFIRNGYYSISINGKYKYIHRLVAQSFINNPENKPCINHKNCNRLDSNVENLEWVTHKENMEHLVSFGKNCRGEKQRCAKVTEPDVLSIRKMYNKKSGYTYKKIAELFGLHRSTVGSIILRETWAHI